MAEADYRLMTEATGQRIAAALEALSLGAVSWSDVVNNLTATEKSVLDARQGKALKDLIDGMVSGVKGNAEGAYRHGDVNITPADIGAVSTSAVIDIPHGGTGATTPAQARANLGAMGSYATGATFGGNANNLYVDMSRIVQSMSDYEARIIVFYIDQTNGIFPIYHTFAGVFTRVANGTGSGVFVSQTGRTIVLHADGGNWGAKLINE